jgi:hypothetical protein
MSEPRTTTTAPPLTLEVVETAPSGLSAPVPSAPAVSPYTDGDRARWRELLLRKGGEVAARLEELLAKKDKTLADFSLWGGDEPGETKERRLRRYFDHLMRRMRAVHHPRFGFDPARGAFVSVVELDAVPWLDVEP